MQLFKSIAVISLAASAQAFAPASFGTRSSMSLFAASDFVYGEYDDKLWSNDNKIKVRPFLDIVDLSNILLKIQNYQEEARVIKYTVFNAVF